MHGGTSVSSTSWYYRKAALMVMMNKVPNNIFLLKKKLEVISALRNRPLPRAPTRSHSAPTAPNTPKKPNVRSENFKNISRLDHSVAGYEFQTRIQDHASGRN